MKRAVLRSIRRSGLLELADRARYWVRRAQTGSVNRRFREANPGFMVPPEDLAFDALNYVTWEIYRSQGLRHARVFARLIEERAPAGPLEVLEWGCGPGRLIRHMPTLLGPRARVTGSDYNERSIAWCAANLAPIRFVTNGLMPPLPFEEGSFDAVYSFSVLTHLSEAAQLAWAQELRRVLKPGGTLVCTTQGERFRFLLADEGEVRRYEAGQVVVQGNYREGRKWFLAIHPERWVRETLLQGYEDVAVDLRTHEPDLRQDIWTARKPAPPAP